MNSTIKTETGIDYGGVCGTGDPVAAPAENFTDTNQDGIDDISGLDATGSITVASPGDADGWAEATWQTQKPNKKGRGGTPPGVYSAETISVTVSGYVWDGVMTSTTFCIDDPSCTQ